MTKKIVYPISSPLDIKNATHFALDQKGRKTILIAHDSECPKCQGNFVIPGLDAIYCYCCQQSFPTKVGVALGWKWNQTEFDHLKKAQHHFNR